MKIAVISDIHGNLEAVNAVVNDIKNEGCEKIFCLGDLAMAGPKPKETIDFIRSLKNNFDFEIIQGNTDEMIAAAQDSIYEKIKDALPVMAEAYKSDIKTVTDEQKEYLKNLPKQKEIKIGDLKILLVHGSPRRNNEDISPNLDINIVEEMIANTDADLILCGHTHIPCGYQTTKNQTVINVGSVGRPFSQEPKSCYLVLTVDGTKNFLSEHKFIEYDFEKSAKILEQRDFDGADKMANMLRHATNRYPQ